MQLVSIRKVRRLATQGVEPYGRLCLLVPRWECYNAGVDRGGWIFCRRRWQGAGGVARIVKIIHFMIRIER